LPAGSMGEHSAETKSQRPNLFFSPYLYRARNLIERFFNKIKQCRRVATRYDKHAANYLAFVKLASIRIWLRANECTLSPTRRVRIGALPTGPLKNAVVIGY